MWCAIEKMGMENLNPQNQTPKMAKIQTPKIQTPKSKPQNSNPKKNPNPKIQTPKKSKPQNPNPKIVLVIGFSDPLGAVGDLSPKKKTLPEIRKLIRLLSEKHLPLGLITHF